MKPESDSYWMEGIIALICIAVIMSALWVAKSTASEVLVQEDEIMMHCFEAAQDAVMYTEFETEEDRMDAISMLTGGCMYYQLIEHSTCEQTPFAYPIEPDGEAGEFIHTF